MAKSKSAVKKAATKSPKKSATKSVSKPRKVAAKKPGLKLAAKPKKKNIGDVFRELLKQKEERRKENHGAPWMGGEAQQSQAQFEKRQHLTLVRTNAPRRKAA